LPPGSSPLCEVSFCFESTEFHLIPFDLLSWLDFLETFFLISAHLEPSLSFPFLSSFFVFFFLRASRFSGLRGPPETPISHHGSTFGFFPQQHFWYRTQIPSTKLPLFRLSRRVFPTSLRSPFTQLAHTHIAFPHLPLRHVVFFDRLPNRLFFLTPAASLSVALSLATRLASFYPRALPHSLIGRVIRLVRNAVLSLFFFKVSSCQLRVPDSFCELSEVPAR